MSNKFKPAEHLRTLTRRRKVKDPNTGKDKWVSEEHQYLDVKWRIVWFRQVYPEGYIETREILVNDQLARIEASIYDSDPSAGGKCLARARRQVMAAGFQDYTEKAETQAVGRALALAGFGTQFCDELDEEESFADSPVEANNNLPSTGGKPGQTDENGIISTEHVYRVAASKGLSKQDTNLLLHFKYHKTNAADLTVEEITEFIQGIKTTSAERLKGFVKKLRDNIKQENIA